MGRTVNEFLLPTYVCAGSPGHDVSGARDGYKCKYDSTKLLSVALLFGPFGGGPVPGITLLDMYKVRFRSSFGKIHSKELSNPGAMPR
jgi:hypothetical protein